MCKCTPEIRTPFCGKPGCEWPQKQVKQTEDERHDAMLPKPGDSISAAADSFTAGERLERQTQGDRLFELCVAWQAMAEQPTETAWAHGCLIVARQLNLTEGRLQAMLEAFPGREKHSH